MRTEAEVLFQQEILMLFYLSELRPMLKELLSNVFYRQATSSLWLETKARVKLLLLLAIH
jgi:hypothetical protein